MNSPDNILACEFIGLETKIGKSSNTQIVGLKGKIVDETKFTFILETERGQKIIPKKHSRWDFFFNDKTLSVSGDKISKRSHQRMVLKP